MLLPNGALLDYQEAKSGKVAVAPVLAVTDRPQRVRKQQRYDESLDPQLAQAIEESRQAAVIERSLGGDSGLSGVCGGSGGAGVAGGAAGGSGAAGPSLQVLRERLRLTLQTMADTPLELRQRKRAAAAVDARCPDVQWSAFCSVCGRHFESLSGSQMLASHAGMHVVHARVSRLRREELPITLQRLRSASQAGSASSSHDLRARLETARKLSRILPDGGLQRALIHAEGRLRQLDRPKPPPALPPTGHQPGQQRDGRRVRRSSARAAFHGRRLDDPSPPLASRCRGRQAAASRTPARLDRALCTRFIPPRPARVRGSDCRRAASIGALRSYVRVPCACRRRRHLRIPTNADAGHRSSPQSPPSTHRGHRARFAPSSMASFATAPVSAPPFTTAGASSGAAAQRPQQVWPAATAGMHAGAVTGAPPMVQGGVAGAASVVTSVPTEEPEMLD